MTTHHWQPLTVKQTVDLLSPLPVPWWVAGGWATDLYPGRHLEQRSPENQNRSHSLAPGQLTATKEDSIIRVVYV